MGLEVKGALEHDALQDAADRRSEAGEAAVKLIVDQFASSRAKEKERSEGYAIIPG
ncbi:hypothetical protein GCM10009624_10710 [Gordonia sinesedis]